MKEIIDLARRFGVDAGNVFEVGHRGALDRLQGAEVAQQRALARRADAGDLLQAGLADVLLALLPMRADGEAMRLVAQPLHEIEHRIARLELERLAARNEEGLAPGVAVRSLGDADQRHVGDAELGERFARGGELAEPAVDQDEIGPGGVGRFPTFVRSDVLCWSRELLSPLPLWERVPSAARAGERVSSAKPVSRGPLARRTRPSPGSLRSPPSPTRGEVGASGSAAASATTRRFRHQPLEPPRQHLAHHAEVVARREVLRVDVELAVLVLAEALRPRDDHRADRVGALDVAVVVDLDAARRLAAVRTSRRARSSRFCCDCVSASLRPSASRALASA